MTELILIRHGETDWNTERRLQGHLDIPLNAEGMRQARALGRTLCNERLDAIVSSDLIRAHETARAVGEACGLPVAVDAALRERCFGGFEGLRHADISERYPDAYRAWQAREFDARLPAGELPGETLREFSARVIEAVVRAARRHAGQRLAIVTHGGVLDCIYRTAHGIGWSGPRDFGIRNASINRLHWSGTALQVLQWSDVAHLDDVALDEIDK